MPRVVLGRAAITNTLLQEDVASKLSHKRTLSETNDNIAESPSALPSNKKAKADTPDTLLALTPHGPNIFYGYADALLCLFDTGENQGDAYWLKSKIIHAYNVLAENEDIDRMACVAISCDRDDLEPPEAKALRSYFEADDGNWWFELTLMRHLPAEAPKKLRVKLESGFYDMQCGVYDGESLGEWWITDISAAEGESETAITTIISEMF